MARPRLDPVSPTARLTIWLPVDLRDQLLARAVAARQSASTFLREAILSGGLPAPVPAINRVAWQKLAATTANLNQISAHINGAALIGRTPDLRALPSVLDELRRDLAALRAGLIAADRRQS